MQMCKHGQWMGVRVDDYFPCRPGQGGPVFSQANGPELWVLLLEKAYAKLHGSYFSLRSGMCYEGLIDLTGAPTLHKRFDEEPCTFEELLKYDRNQFLICCSTPGHDQMTEGSRPGESVGGLVPGHAYTLIAAKRLESGAHAGAELLKIRNPWGNFEWDGDFSDNSTQLADPETRRLLYDDETTAVVEEPCANDGAFWMTFADFQRHFVSLSVCMAHVPLDCWRSCTMPGGGAQALPPGAPAGSGGLGSAAPLCMWPDVVQASGLGDFVPTAGTVCRLKSHFASVETAAPPTRARATAACGLVVHPERRRTARCPRE